MNNKTSKNKFSKEKYHLLCQFLHGCIGFFVLCMMTAILSAFANTVQPQIIRTAIDCIIGNKNLDLPKWLSMIFDSMGGMDFLHNHLWIFSLLIFGVAIIQVIASYVFRVMEAIASGKLIQNIRNDLFTHIQHLPFSWFSQNQTGDLIQRSTSDVDTLKRFLSEQMTSIIRILLTLILAGCFMFSMHMWLAFVALASLPIFVVISFVFNSKLAKNFAECEEQEGKLSTIAQENLSGVRVIRAFGREIAEIEHFKQQNRSYTDLRKRVDRLISYFWCSTDVLAGLQIMSILISGTIFCLHGTLTEGEFIAFLTYDSMLLWPVRELGEIISNMAQASVSLERIYQIMAVPTEKDTPSAKDCPNHADIVFSHVSFSYDEKKEVLHDINFNLKAGTSLGILGGTGSGKSTLMFLLDKLYLLNKEQGKITIGGMDINDIRTESLRQNIGIVTQEPYLFSATLGENIRLTKENASDKEVETATRAAALTETIRNFTNGYDTPVGEGGVTLSGGQKQRVAIARTLLANTPILIFDDSLSAVDTTTDQQIRQAIKEKFGQATVILISHRISTVSAADHILVLDHGRIAEEGTHHFLKSAGGIYQQICDIQNSTTSI